MPINEKEFQSIKILEEEIIEAQAIEALILSTKGTNPVQKVVNNFATKPSLYTDPVRMQSMINELEQITKAYVKKANKKGKLFSRKRLDKYLEDSEKRDISQRQLRLINQATERQAQRKLKTTFMEIAKEKNILKSDIAIFKARSKIAGLTNKEILKQLVIAGKDKTGFVQGFANRIKKIDVAAVRRETSDSKIAEYKKQALPKEKWQWITVSSTPCPDCQARAGKIMFLWEWERIGLPGDGRTICGAHCKCNLLPVSISEDMFPTVKTFTWNPKKQVLTTASEARTLNAKKNQPPQKVKK
jgi:hypothetical protein